MVTTRVVCLGPYSYVPQVRWLWHWWGITSYSRAWPVWAYTDQLCLCTHNTEEDAQITLDKYFEGKAKRKRELKLLK